LATPKRALITGITGQDGSYLAELLLAKGYEVIGMVRRSSTVNFERIKHIQERLTLVSGDLLDQASLMEVLGEYHPGEVYNLAAQSFVQTPFYPRSPYGVAKVYGHWITVNYRESYNLFAVSGICFNHESPRRGHEFVTRKIARAAARISLGLEHELLLGNLNAQRDWGYAPDYVEGMWRMLQQDSPEDYVLSTGRTHTVERFADLAFAAVNRDYRDYIRLDPRFVRPADVDLLVGDPSKARRLLGWEATTSFERLVQIMVQAELAANA
jgi:GDPmannose 4,6-dehydratase